MANQGWEKGKKRELSRCVCIVALIFFGVSPAVGRYTVHTLPTTLLQCQSVTQQRNVKRKTDRGRDDIVHTFLFARGLVPRMIALSSVPPFPRHQVNCMSYRFAFRTPLIQPCRTGSIPTCLPVLVTAGPRFWEFGAPMTSTVSARISR